ncbi:hypothetical protein ALP91_02673 [Pseudomonas savastanoi pv. glycinea]|nr:hypothetical protein ALP91_02673 [Pseudomonas savastanoi pv. glycinea]
MPKRLCSSCCKASNGRGGQRSRSAIKLAASRRGSRRGVRGLNTDNTARNRNSSATPNGSRPINTASRAGQTRSALEKNRHNAPTSRTISVMRTSCASAPASGDWPSGSLLSCRSMTNSPNANSNRILPARLPEVERSEPDNVRFQKARMTINASTAHPASHRVELPMCRTSDSPESLSRVSRRSYQAVSSSACAVVGESAATGAANRAGTPHRDVPGRLQARSEQYQRRRRIAQHGHPQ